MSSWRSYATFTTQNDNLVPLRLFHCDWQLSIMTFHPIFIASNSCLKTNFREINTWTNISMIRTTEFWFFSLAHVPSANMEKTGFMTYDLQPATGGWLRCFGFTFGELSCCPSLYAVYGSASLLQDQMTSFLSSRQGHCAEHKAFSGGMIWLDNCPCGMR